MKKVYKLFYSVIIIVVIASGTYLIALFHAGYLHSSLSPEVSSNVGGFIGGVIGPIISMAVLALVYYTYKMQSNQNVELRMYSNLDFLMEMHESIIKAVSNLEFKVSGSVYRGEVAIIKYNPHQQDLENVYIDKLNYVINSYNLLINDCKNKSNISKYFLKSEEAYENLITKFYLSFYSNIIWAILANKGSYLDMKKNHDDSEYIFNTFSILAEETFVFLMDRNLIAKNNQWKTESLNSIKKFRIENK